MTNTLKWQLDHLVSQIASVCEITDTGCWLWRYRTWRDRDLTECDDYPRLMIHGIRKAVGYWVLEACVGSRPDGTEMCHSCDNPPCCSPEHLRWATHQENMLDMSVRDRSGSTRRPEHIPRGDSHWTRKHPEKIRRGPHSRESEPLDYPTGDDHWTRRSPDEITWRGTSHHASRLNEDLVRVIRQRGHSGETATEIAGSLGVGRGTIRAVLDGRTWKHVT